MQSPGLFSIQIVIQSCGLKNPNYFQICILDCTSPLSPEFINNQCFLTSLLGFLTVSHIRVFFIELALGIRWPKYWSFSISPSNEHPGLISFRMDWLDLLAVQGTLKNLLQHHSSEASILQCSAFFTVQLSHPYMTTGKTTAQATVVIYGSGNS